MKKVEVILKVTDACNLRCKYCYNSEKGYKKNCVSLENFEKLLTLLLERYNLIHIIWHGGEPLTAGLDYFERAMEIERKINMRSSVTIENSVQTNATLINDAWIKFFKKNNFRIGISFDGEDNEKYRQQTDKTLKAMKKLRAAGVNFSCLAVVADDDYDLKKNYLYFKNQKISFDFSRVFNEGAARELKKTSAESFAKKLIDLFDEWLYDVDGVSVRTFAAYLNMALGGKSRICNCSSCHGKYICLTPDGNLYNCGREGLTAYPFGNIENIGGIGEAFSSEGAKKLIGGSIARREKCKSCEYFSLCQGGCADIAIGENGLENIPEISCYLFKTVYSHIVAKIGEVIEKKTPLDRLNPAVKAVMAKCFTRMGGEMHTEVAESYLKL